MKVNSKDQVVFLVDVDDTLLDNDAAQNHLPSAHEAELRPAGCRPLLEYFPGTVRGARLCRLSRRSATLSFGEPARSPSFADVLLFAGLSFPRSALPARSRCPHASAKQWQDEKKMMHLDAFQ